MFVKDLIEKLQKCDPDAIVVCSSDNFELNSARVEAERIHERYGKKFMENFRDAFDYTDYSTEVIRYGKEGEEGSIKIVSITE